MVCSARGVFLAGRNPPGRPRSGRDLDRERCNRSSIVLVHCLARRIPTHVRINPPEGGLTRPSFVLCEQLRRIERLIISLLDL